MDANKIRLLEFLGSSKRTFNIPVYQRNYDWKKEQCVRLFKDIENIALNNFEIEHFIGTIVYLVSSIQPSFMELVLIDGQQRITSVTLLIKALYDSISDEELRADIYETYLINKHAPESLRIKLKPIESDCIAYEDIIANKTISEEKDGSNIVKNYNLFKKLVTESPVKPEELYQALNKVELVYIALDKDKKSENPQLIFESLNSTGLSLTQADLIRNFLLMNHAYDEQTRLYKQYWIKIESLLTNSSISDFVRDYLTMKTGTIPNKDKVYISFKTFAYENKNYDEEGLLEDLLIYAEYYSWFSFCNSPYKKINELLLQLQQLKSTVTYPALLYIFEDCFSYKIIDTQQLEDILITILSYLYRRIICGYPTNSLNKIFSSLINEISKSNKSNYNEMILNILASKTASGIFPRDEEFKREFISKDLYKTKIDKYTLYQLESYCNKEVIDLTNDITIEHIMPQRLTPAWQIELGNKFDEIHNELLHTIGNLTLTGYNSELSNKSFDDKKCILIQSNISISRNLIQFETWNADSIKKRAAFLFEFAKSIWALPEKYNAQNPNTSAIDYSATYNIMDDINVTGEKPKQLIILDMEYNVSSWKDVIRELCSQLYELDSDTFRSFAKHKDFIGRDRKVIDSKGDDMISPYKIAENLFVETNMSANTIINYCKIIVEHYSLQDDIFFLLRAQ
ncbi:MAG: DUF262 domain-containing HNH endonuclease family protein [Oscillospiraceae bacterium]|jgi:uncharacterized protein with ParB-like and HNH nuclease domain|nr:DUF262 domain-containing HNH endonuclease family protein [Oscillospiraceae bacterium]